MLRYAVESGWLTEGQLLDSSADRSFREQRSHLGEESCNESIIEAQIVERNELELRRSPRRRTQRVLA